MQSRRLNRNYSGPPFFLLFPLFPFSIPHLRPHMNTHAVRTTWRSSSAQPSLAIINATHQCTTVQASSFGDARKRRELRRRELRTFTPRRRRISRIFCNRISSRTTGITGVTHTAHCTLHTAHRTLHACALQERSVFSSRTMGDAHAHPNREPSSVPTFRSLQGHIVGGRIRVGGA